MASVRRRSLLAGAVLTGLAAFLLLWRLDVPLLWQDEAETANVAANLLERGHPTPWDGRHLVTQQAGRDSVRIGERILWAWHPWLQHYLAAAGLGLLGHGTAQARLPFALVALASVPLFFAWRLRRCRFPTAVVATAIYALSPVFFIYSRQSRYYALLFLGGVWALRAYQALAPRRIAPSLSLGGALALLFYANPLSGLAFAAGLGAHGALQRHRREEDFAALARSLALFALLASPWLVLMAISDVRTPDLGLGARLGLLASQLWRLQYTLLPAVLWPVLCWLWWRARPTAPAAAGASASARPQAARELELLAILALVSWLAVAAQAPMGSARYALALWPLAAAALAALWEVIDRRSAAAGGALLALLLFTNAFQALPALPVALARWNDPRTTHYAREAPVADKLAFDGRPTAPLPLHLARLARRGCGPVAAGVALARALDGSPRLVVASYGYESFHFYLGAPAAGPGAQAGRLHLGLPPLDPARADLVVPRSGWPAPDLGPDLDPGPDSAYVAFDTGVADHPYENFPDPTGLRFVRAAPGALPPLTVWVRRELLPPEGFGTLQAPGCAPLPPPRRVAAAPAASTSTAGVNATR